LLLTVLLHETSKGNGGRYEHANPVSLKAQDGRDHMTMNRDYAWLMISRQSSSSQAHVKDQANVQKLQPSGGYHAVPPPTTRTFMPPKPDLVFHTAPVAIEIDHSAFTVQLSPSKPAQDLSHTNRPTVPIIEDWVSNSKDESETKVPHIVPSFVYNSPPRVTAVQAPVVSAAQGNMSYLSEFEELNGGYVAFGGNPKGGKISGKGKIMTCKLDFDDVYFVKELKFNLFIVSQICNKKNSVLFTDTECLVLSPNFKLPDESQVLLRVPRENNMYNVNLKNIVSVLVTKPHNKTPFGLLHGRTPSIGFMRPFSCPVTILNTLDSLGKFDGKVDEGFMVGYSVNSKAFRVFNSKTRIVHETLHNYNEDAAFDGMDHDFDAKKPKSEVILSPSSGAQSKKQDDKKKKEAKGKSLVESFTVYRDLSAEFEDCSKNSRNESWKISPIPDDENDVGTE
nr:ribonuclease H-like domain-containing protein [Tanacetum cinerariifolium]